MELCEKNIKNKIIFKQVNWSLAALKFYYIGAHTVWRHMLSRGWIMIKQRSKINTHFCGLNDEYIGKRSISKIYTYEMVEYLKLKKINSNT